MLCTKLQSLKIDSSDINLYIINPDDFLNNPKSFKDIYKDSLVNHQMILNYITVGTENSITMGQGIIKLFVGILNTVLHMVNTIKTYITKGFQNLKRTELRYFHDSNTVSVKRILNKDYSELAYLSVPIPHGFNDTYPSATSKGLACLSTMNMLSRTNSFVSYVTSIKQNILSGKGLPATNFDDMTNDTNIQKLFSIFDLCFQGKHLLEVEFNKAFPSATSFPETDTLLLESEKYQYEVNNINNNLSSCEKEMRDILSYLIKNPNALTKESLTNLSTLCTSLAKMFDMFGSTIQDISKIEHNYVVILHMIKKEFQL